MPGEETLHSQFLEKLLIGAMSKCSRKTLIVSPFIKTPILENILQALRANVQLTVVTNWSSSAVLSGATDVEIFEVVRKNGGSVFVNNNLHAKYYRFDEKFWLGSANISVRALADSSGSSLEILYGPVMCSIESEDFEHRLLLNSKLVTDDLYRTYKELHVVFGDNSTQEFDYLPVSPEPTSLWGIYNGDEKFPRAESLKDLSILAVPLGLDFSDFLSNVRLRLLDFQKFRKILVFIDSNLEGRRYGEMRSFVKDLHVEVEGREGWEVVFQWILYFFGDEYEYFRPNYSEMIRLKNRDSGL